MRALLIKILLLTCHHPKLLIEILICPCKFKDFHCLEISSITMTRYDNAYNDVCVNVRYIVCNHMFIHVCSNICNNLCVIICNTACSAIYKNVCKPQKTYIGAYNQNQYKKSPRLMGSSHSFAVLFLLPQKTNVLLINLSQTA